MESDSERSINLFGKQVDVFEAIVDESQRELLSVELPNDPAAIPLFNQVKNHLRHVSYRFRIARDSEDYPYEVEENASIPKGPREVAVQRSKRLLRLLSDDTLPGENYLEYTYESFTNLIESQDEIVNDLLQNPLEVYADFKKRREEQGDEAQFPELGITLRALNHEVVHKPEVHTACSKSPLLSKLRKEIFENANEKIQNNDFGYNSTLWMIEDTMAFFDLVTRVNVQDSPPAYHTSRFEYNWYSLAEDKDITLIPTMASVDSEDLLKFRNVPVGIIGVSTDTITVDGFPQTPYEFFYHDVDHTRRMHDATMMAVEREGVSIEKFAQDSTSLLVDKLLPEIDVDGVEDRQEYDRRIAMRMILFEILHEDGADPSPDSIADGILRPPLERTPFERMVDEKTVEYFMSPRASTLAHVFRKLAHTFYDLPDRRSQKLGTDYVRTRQAIAQGAADLYRLVSDDPIDDEALLNTCRDLVSTDEGFTDAFIGNIAHDISRQAVGQRALSMMVTKPLGVHAAVRSARNELPRLHSLFGYSGLDYEDPKSLEQTIIEDLKYIDPEETAIAIGATPYGIGRMYPILKDLGYFTVGIVASTAVGRNEPCAEGVDKIVVVKDNGWGGYRYSGATNGLLSPTTRVFVGASDSVAAYGGGSITVVTLEEMQRREKSWTYRPFDMNHKIADMSSGQKGETNHVDYRGPAYEKALNLERQFQNGNFIATS